MKSEDVAARFDDRAGFKLINYAEVGLQVYGITATALLVEKKGLSPIEEFVLRAVRAGFIKPSDISEFLGLGLEVIIGTVSNLIRSEDLYERSSDSTVHVTPKGNEAARSAIAVRPSERTIFFHFDGLTRKPCWYGNRGLVGPKQTELAGLRQIRAFPARKPTVDEINVEDVFDAMKLAVRGVEESKQLLRIREVRKGVRLFMPAVMLIYKSSNGPEVQVGFAIDGRRSEKHEIAFLQANGPKRLGILTAIEKGHAAESLSDFSVAEQVRIEQERIKHEPEVSEIKQKSSAARFKTDLAEQKVTDSSSESERSAARSELNDRRDEIALLESGFRKMEVRTVAVYEHPMILRQAIANAKERLLIRSPWISPAVVDRRMEEELEALLSRGTELYIGYGLEHGAVHSKEPNQAVQRLQILSNRYPNFHFLNLGDTHAKVLVKDSDYFVNTSFNWLSFRGDSKRTFREEWGTYVAIPELVEKHCQKLLERFNDGS